MVVLFYLRKIEGWNNKASINEVARGYLVNWYIFKLDKIMLNFLWKQFMQLSFKVLRTILHDLNTGVSKSRPWEKCRLPAVFVFLIKFYWDAHMPTCLLTVFCYNGRIEYCQQSLYGSQKPKILTIWPFIKNAVPFLNTIRKAWHTMEKGRLLNKWFRGNCYLENFFQQYGSD